MIRQEIICDVCAKKIESAQYLEIQANARGISIPGLNRLTHVCNIKCFAKLVHKWHESTKRWDEARRNLESAHVRGSRRLKGQTHSIGCFVNTAYMCTRLNGSLACSRCGRVVDDVIRDAQIKARLHDPTMVEARTYTNPSGDF